MDKVSALINGDLLLKFLRNIIKKPSKLSSLWFVLILNIPILVLAYFNNSLFGSNSRVGLLNDGAWWGYQFTGVLASVYYFLWLPDGIIGVFKGLRDNKVIIKPNSSKNEIEKFEDFLSDFVKTYTQMRWSYLSGSIVILVILFAAIPEYRSFSGWQTSCEPLFWFHAIFWAFIFYLVAINVIRTLICIHFINDLFKKFNTDIRILHPDGAGGLSPLGNFNVKIGYMIGIYGLVTVIAIWSQFSYLTPGHTSLFDNKFTIVIGLFWYLIIAPLAFFLPIGSAHASMKNAKYKTILAISDQFENDFSQLQQNLNKGGEEFSKTCNKIENLQKIYSMANRFPIWPFNTANLVRFFSSIISPLVIGIIPSIIEIIFKK